MTAVPYHTSTGTVECVVDSRVWMCSIIYPYVRTYIRDIVAEILYHRSIIFVLKIMDKMELNTTTTKDVVSIVEGKQKEATTTMTTVCLNDLYLYQKQDESISRIPMTVWQLCRMMCPKTNIINALQTHVLQHTTTTNSNKWQLATTIPIFLYASSWWYYTTTTNNTIQGPISCRDLATIITTTTTTPTTTIIHRVWSNTACNEWSLYEQQPNLQLALLAFQSQQSQQQNSMDQTTNNYPLQNNDNDDNHNMIQIMTYQDNDHHDAEKNNQLNEEEQEQEAKAQKELQDFFSSTKDTSNQNDDDDDDEEYTSDNGTKYIKCHRTGKWIHEDLVPSKYTKNDSNKNDKHHHDANQQLVGKKRNANTNHTTNNGTHKNTTQKKLFRTKNYKNWIYVTNLPPDIQEEMVATYFSKVGLLDMDPQTQLPKIKLYRDKQTGKLKGDASICYSRPESVDMAIQFLDESYIDHRTQYKLHVERAKFEQHGSTYHNNLNQNKQQKAAQAKHKVIRLAKAQAMGWEDDTENGRITGGRKGLRIIVVRQMFQPVDDLSENECTAIETDILKQWGDDGAVEKITLFSKCGVVIIKFKQPHVASQAINFYNQTKKMHTIYWDGVTDYTTVNYEKEEEDTNNRLEDFGNWLDNQQVPEEFKLRVEGETNS